MTKVVEQKLPNGVVPFQNIPDSKSREAVMKLNENIASLSRQINALVRAVTELQRK